MEPRTYRINEIGYERTPQGANMHIMIDGSVIIYNIVAQCNPDNTENPYTINYGYLAGRMLESLGVLYAIGSVCCRFFIECTLEDIKEAKIDRRQRDLTIRDEQDFDVVFVDPTLVEAKDIIVDSTHVK